MNRIDTELPNSGLFCEKLIQSAQEDAVYEWGKMILERGTDATVVATATR